MRNKYIGETGRTVKLCMKKRDVRKTSHNQHYESTTFETECQVY